MTLARFSGPELDIEAALMLADYPTQYAAVMPNDTALVFGDHVTSWRDLDRLSNAFRGLLEDWGVPAGGRIAYFGRNSDLFFPVVFGAVRAGVILVPINWRYTAVEASYLLEDSGASVVITDAEFEPIIRAALNERDTRIMLTDGPDDLRSALHGREPVEAPSADPGLTFVQLYTSGTTGKPKGVMLSQRAVAVSRHSELRSVDFGTWGPGDVLLSSMPTFHIAGIAFVLCGLLRGVPCVITADASPASILDLCLQHDVTRTYMVPSVLRSFLEETRRRGVSPRKLDVIHYGASVIDVPLLQAAIAEIGCGFLQYYGMTEIAGGAVTLGPQNHLPERPERLKSVGQTMPGCEIEIRDPAGRLCQLDEPGEIWLKCPGLMTGYAGLPEATAEAVVDGWYRSGDGGYLNAEGFLYLTDRIKDMIITGGENVYPAEVEQALRSHAAILDAAVVGMPDERWGETVVAVIEVREGVLLVEADLIAHARKSLAGFKIPRRLFIHERLPRNASGKVQRNLVRLSLREPEGAGS
jgi:acyl-CoA synthetase (AMP-forming)/AMP-acid ligase II